MGLRLVALSFELLVFSKRRRAICPWIIECACVSFSKSIKEKARHSVWGTEHRSQQQAYRA